MGGPSQFGVHPPRQSIHQPPQFVRVFWRVQGVDAVGLESLRGFRRTKEMSKPGRRLVTMEGAIDHSGFRNLERRRLDSFSHRHCKFSPLSAFEVAEPAVKLS